MDKNQYDEIVKKVSLRRKDVLENSLTVHEHNTLTNTNPLRGSLDSFNEYLQTVNKLFTLFDRYDCMLPEDFKFESIYHGDSDNMGNPEYHDIYFVDYDGFKTGEVKFINDHRTTIIYDTCWRTIKEMSGNVIVPCGLLHHDDKRIIIVKMCGDIDKVTWFLLKNKENIIDQYNKVTSDFFTRLTRPDNKE